MSNSFIALHHPQPSLLCASLCFHPTDVVSVWNNIICIQVTKTYTNHVKRREMVPMTDWRRTHGETDNRASCFCWLNHNESRSIQNNKCPLSAQTSSKVPPTPHPSKNEKFANIFLWYFLKHGPGSSIWPSHQEPLVCMICNIKVWRASELTQFILGQTSVSDKLN